MKKISLITLLALSTISFQSKAQESSSVMITVITYGKEITLQVIDDQNKVSNEELKFSKDKPEQAILKSEMDKWIKKGYQLSQSYGYVQSGLYMNSSGQISSTRYETLILTK